MSTSVGNLKQADKSVVFVLIMLSIYCLPIFGISISCIASGGFKSNSDTVYMASAISGDYISFIRDSFGAIVVPLLTAYVATNTAGAATGILGTRDRVIVMSYLVSVLLISIVLLSFMSISAVELANFVLPGDSGPAGPPKPMGIATLFRTTVVAYVKEILAYIALLLGISIKK